MKNFFVVFPLLPSFLREYLRVIFYSPVSLRSAVLDAKKTVRNGAKLTIMVKFMRTHVHKILAGHSLLVVSLIFIGGITLTVRPNIIGLLAAATSSLSSAPVILYFTPYVDQQLQVGETTDIDVNINSKIPINALGVTIKFPQDTVEVVGFSKVKSFLDLWTEETAIDEEAGKVHFSGGTLEKGGMTGTSTVITLSIRAKKAGDARLYFENTEVFASDGKGVPVNSDLLPVTMNIPQPPAPPAPQETVGGSGTSMSAPGQPLPRSADLNGDGKVSLIDASIMAIHLFGPYDPRFDLDMDGVIGFSDFSIVLSKIGTTDKK